MYQQCAVGAFTAARNCAPNEVLSSGTNMFQEAFERMTKDTTVTAPFTMKIKVVAPPGGNIFTVGAKRFHCAEVLPREVFAVPVSLLIGRAVSKRHQCFVCASRFPYVLLYSFADQVLAQLELFWYSHVVLSGITKSECFVCSHRHRLDRIPLPPGLFSPLGNDNRKIRRFAVRLKAVFTDCAGERAECFAACMCEGTFSF